MRLDTSTEADLKRDEEVWTTEREVDLILSLSGDPYTEADRQGMMAWFAEMDQRHLDNLRSVTYTDVTPECPNSEAGETP